MCCCFGCRSGHCFEIRGAKRVDPEMNPETVPFGSVAEGCKVEDLLSFINMVSYNKNNNNIYKRLLSS